MITAQLVESPASSPVVVAEVAPAPPRPGWLGRLFRGLYQAWVWLLGVAALILGLAILASLPVFQFLSLGYLLEVCGRVARTGKLRSAWVGIEQGARLGGIALGSVLAFVPLIILASQARSARLIDPGGRADRLLTVALAASAVLGFVHVASALWRGGKFRHFLWPAPLRTLRFLRAILVHPIATYLAACDAVARFVTGLRLPYYFWLGLRGAAGAFVWLFVPMSLLAAGRNQPVVALIGGFMFGVILLYLPFLQGRFAATNRLRAMFEIGAARYAFRRAPLMFVIALALTLTLAVPLYLAKIEMIPRDAAWLPCLFFVVLNWPARFFTGWALARGAKREQPRNFFVRQLGRLTMIPLVAAYALIVYVTQYISWYGVASLYAQHPFLVPVPFFTFAPQ